MEVRMESKTKIDYCSSIHNLNLPVPAYEEVSSLLCNHEFLGKKTHMIAIGIPTLLIIKTSATRWVGRWSAELKRRTTMRRSREERRSTLLSEEAGPGASTLSLSSFF